jgi:hypothetical protein
MKTSKIYAYITSATCTAQRAVKPGTEAYGKPVSKCGDYEPWMIGKRVTLDLISQGNSNVSMRRWQSARLVAVLLGWAESTRCAYDVVD